MDSTPDRHCEILSAWIDGERTDPAAVHAALGTSDGRAFVIDAMALRRAVDLTAAVTSRDEPQAARHRRPSWIAAAAGAVLCAGLGYGVAQVTSRDAAARPGGETVEVVPVSAPGAPQPTHVIRFESGVDWRETSGGN